MHALLFRKWQNNVKGRDWYDMEWYRNTMTEEEFRNLLKQKTDSVNMGRVKEDIKRFIPNQDGLKIWSSQYFHDLAEKMIVDSSKQL